MGGNGTVQLGIQGLGNLRTVSPGASWAGDISEGEKVGAGQQLPSGIMWYGEGQRGVGAGLAGLSHSPRPVSGAWAVMEKHQEIKWHPNHAGQSKQAMSFRASWGHGWRRGIGHWLTLAVAVPRVGVGRGRGSRIVV